MDRAEARMDHLADDRPVDRAPESAARPGCTLKDELAGLAEHAGQERKHEEAAEPPGEALRRLAPAGVRAGYPTQGRQPCPDQKGERPDRERDRRVRDRAP